MTESQKSPRSALGLCRLLLEKDLKEGWQLAKDYTELDMSFEAFKAFYTKYPSLHLAYYLNNELVGICFPDVVNGEIVIGSLAVKKAFWRRGIGSSLLSCFERAVKATGQEELTVGAADIEWVERFYMKNGYEPKHLLVQIDDGAMFNPSMVPLPLERRDGRKLYFRAAGYSPKLRGRVAKLPGVKSANYIMWKSL